MFTQNIIVNFQQSNSAIIHKIMAVFRNNRFVPSKGTVDTCASLGP